MQPSAARQPVTYLRPTKKNPPLTSSQGGRGSSPGDTSARTHGPTTPDGRPTAPVTCLPPASSPGGRQQAARARPEQLQEAKQAACGGHRMHQHRWALPAKEPSSMQPAWLNGLLIKAPLLQPCLVRANWPAIATQAPEPTPAQPGSQVAGVVLPTQGWRAGRHLTDQPRLISMRHSTNRPISSGGL